MCYMVTTRTPAVYQARAEHDRGSGLAQVGVRELRQNLSVYLRRIEAGETLEVTERGQPVARLTPLPPQHLGALERLIAEGRAIPATSGNLAEIGQPPEIGPGPTLSDILAVMRSEDDR